MDATAIRALTFDVFGTVVDWRSSVIREGEALGAELGLDVDWVGFADAWRQLYQPTMQRVRSGEIPFARLDDLHRMSLDTLVERFDLKGLTEEQLQHLNRAWHRLDPWPDAVPGLLRLRRRFILATLSNGNVSLMVNMARRAGLPWDAILGAEPTGHYKPEPEAYLGTAAYLDLRPEECMMVAAHNDDLVAAGALGFATGFVYRPTEYGPHQSTDLEPERAWDVVARDFLDLARQLGC